MQSFIILIIVILAILLCYFIFTTDNTKSTLTPDYHQMEYNRLGQVINESIALFNTSSNIETRISRISVAIELLERLFERFPDHEDNQHNMELYNMCIQSQKDVHFHVIEIAVEKYMLKSRVAKTHSAKINNAVKALEHIEIGLANEFIEKNKLKELKEEIEEYISKTELDNFELKASKLEAKGMKKKAKNVYIDALFYIKNDAIDDSKQLDVISEIESKIQKLSE